LLIHRCQFTTKSLVVMKILNDTYLDYILVFILLCISGNPLFCMSRPPFIIALLFAIAIVFKRGCIFAFSDFFKYQIPFFLLFCCQFVVCGDIKITSVLFFIMKTLTAFLLIGSVNSRFPRTLINTMWFLCIVAIIGHILTLFFGVLPGIPCAKIANSQIIFSQHIASTVGLQYRNCGMFWEPGAFAGYICVILLFMMKSPSNYSYKYYLPLIIALLTTTSTTGYIVFGIVVLYYILSSKNLSSTTKVLLFVISVICMISAYKGLDFMQQKIQSEGAESSRISDYDKYSTVIKENIIFGRSMINVGDDDALQISTGNGFVWFWATFGIIGVLSYFIPLFHMAKRISTRYSIFFCICVALLLQGEGFLSFPLFLGLPYALSWLDSNELDSYDMIV